MAYTTIDDPEAYFQVNTYTGDGNDNRDLVLPGDTDMQPDMIWTKNRDTTDPHTIVDAVRGGTKTLFSNDDAAEGTNAESIKSFDTDGFTTGNHRGTGGNDGNTMVAWCWKESAVSGMDIVSYTGNATDDTDISHSLSAVPHVIIIKNRDQGSGYNWRVYHHKNTSAPETDRLNLNDTNATHDDASYWSDEAPTSSVFTLGTDVSLNGNTEGHVAYLWSEKQGFSKFGSYTGNGNADGTFVFCGFRPAWIMIKRTSGTQSWTILDNKRLGYNDANERLYPDEAYVEDSASFDFLSNGFKPRITGNNLNGSGETYIYMAFAEAPFVNSNGVPCNAR